MLCGVGDNLVGSFLIKIIKLCYTSFWAVYLLWLSNLLSLVQIVQLSEQFA